MKEIKNIVVVGGGTAGLTSALILKQYFPSYNITIIKSPIVEIVGVGEGSTEHFDTFLEFTNQSVSELISKTGATVKIGILFNDWNHKNHSYCHSVFSNSGLSIFGTQDHFNISLLKNSSSPYPLSGKFSEIYYKNRVPITPNFKVSNQYHFDTFKLNQYLIEKCKERNINIIEEHIDNVNLDNEGNIITLTSTNGFFIKGDFFIDCSGFKRILSSKLGVKWISYKDYLPLNQAITLPTNLDLKKGIEPYTTATVLQNGWTWKIPTQTRYGNGYVFSNEYTTPDRALNELNTHLGINVEKIAKDVKFEAGKVDKFWIKNCVNIGLAGSFAEPLEAQSIGFSIIQATILGNFLNSWKYDSKVSKSFNKMMDTSFNNIIDYLQIHYLNKKDSSKFWKDKPFKLTEFNISTQERFSYGIFNPSDFNNSNYTMFSTSNFYQVYYGLGLITPQKILKTHQSLPPQYTQSLSQIYSQHTSTPLPNHISHWEYLKLVKENHSS